MRRWRKHGPDYVFIDEGSIWLVRPLTEHADAHLRENASDATWFGDACVVEDRFVRDLAEGLAFEGFNVVRR